MLDNKQKAVAAFIVTLLTSTATALLTALQAVGDGATLGDLSQAAWLTVIIAVLASTGLTTGAVYGFANRPKDAVKNQDGSYRITGLDEK